MEKLIKGLPVKEYHILATRKWRAENSERKLETERKWRANNKEKQREYNKKWCQEHREERTEYEKERKRRKKLEEQNNISKGE